MAGEAVKQWICKSLEKNEKVWLASPLVTPVIEPPGHVGVACSLSTAASPGGSSETDQSEAQSLAEVGASLFTEVAPLSTNN